MESITKLCELLGGNYRMDSSDECLDADDDRYVDMDESVPVNLIDVLRQLLDSGNSNSVDNEFREYRRELKAQRMRRKRQEQVARESLNALMMELGREKDIADRLRNVSRRCGLRPGHNDALLLNDDCNEYYDDGDRSGIIEDTIPMPYNSGVRALRVENSDDKAAKKREVKDRKNIKNKHAKVGDSLADILRSITASQSRYKNFNPQQQVQNYHTEPVRQHVYQKNTPTTTPNYREANTKLAEKVYKQVQNDEGIADRLQNILDAARRELHMEKLHETFDCQNVQERDLVEKLHNVLECSRARPHHATVAHPMTNSSALNDVVTPKSNYQQHAVPPIRTYQAPNTLNKYDVPRSSESHASSGDVIGCVLDAVNSVLQQRNFNANPSPVHQDRPAASDSYQKMHADGAHDADFLKNTKNSILLEKPSESFSHNASKEQESSPVPATETCSDKENLDTLKRLYEISKQVMNLHTEYYEFFMEKNRLEERNLKYLDFQLTQYLLKLDSLHVKDEELRMQRRDLSRLINKMLSTVDSLKSKISIAPVEENPSNVQQKNIVDQNHSKSITVNDHDSTLSNTDVPNQSSGDLENYAPAGSISNNSEPAPPTSNSSLADTNDIETTTLDKTGWISDVETDIETRPNTSPLITVKYVEGKNTEEPVTA